MRTTLAIAALLFAALPATASAVPPVAEDVFQSQQASDCGYQYRCVNDFRTGRRLCYRVPCVQKRSIPG